MTDNYLEKGYFFVCTTLPIRGQNMASSQKWTPFFVHNNLVFDPKMHFLPYDPKFCQQPSERRFIFHLGIDFSTFCFRVTAVFVKKKTADAPKSLPQSQSQSGWTYFQFYHCDRRTCKEKQQLPHIVACSWSPRNESDSPSTSKHWMGNSYYTWAGGS